MARRRRGAGISALFVVLGLVAILGGTFAAGFFTGRHWERVRVVAGLVKPQAGKEPERRALAGKPTDTPAVAPLTFYQELTAPLSSPGRQGGTPPRTPRPVTPPTGRSMSASASTERSLQATAVVPATRASARAAKTDTTPERTGAERTAAPEARAEPNAEPVTQAKAAPENTADTERARAYTVQVAAYGTRAQAESLVQRLGTLGFEGDVSETTTPGGVRYRVRVGTYPSKEAARDAASRLGAATGLGGFVAAR